MDKFIPSKMTFKGYKCFVEECTIPWFSSFNVIIGRNNSGKSSFLDIIHALCDAYFRADISRTIDITMTYTIDSHRYFDIDHVAYGSSGFALPYFGYHFMNKEIAVHVNLSQTNFGKSYVNSYDIDSKTLSDDQCSLKLRDDIIIDPFNNSVFRCVASERDINQEPFFSESEQIEIDSNGIGTTRYACSILNNKNKNDAIIQEDLLNALNEILGPDGHYRNIKINEKEEKVK